MSDALRPRSLFWTFAGVFLAVLVAATAMQIVTSIMLLRPLEEAGMRAQAEARLGRIAAKLGSLPAGSDAAAVRAVFRSERGEGPGGVSYLRADGTAVHEPPMPAEFERVVWPLLHDGRDRVAFGDGPRIGAHDRTRDSMRFGPPGVPSVAAPAPADRGPLRALVVTARLKVAGTNGESGVLVVLRPEERHFLPRGGAARALALYVPVAVLAAAIAGLLMVRVLAKRLRALDDSLARVARGELGTQVGAGPDDEIGRLEQRFNAMTESLSAARRHAEALEEQRRHLLSDIAHELATPLTSIRGYVETLLDPAVPTSAEERERYLRDVLAESERLDLLIRDLLELVRLEAGASTLAAERLDWAALARHTVRRFERRFADAGVSLRWEGGESEAWVHADGRRMEQALDNLLANALRYVPAGGTVRVSTARVERGGVPVRVLAVEDDGPGIPPEDLGRVFERFWRAESARETPGSGLGLAILREIMRRHDGDATVTSVHPHGARFELSLLES